MPNVFFLDTKGGRQWNNMLPSGTRPCSYGTLTGLKCEGMNGGDVLVFHHEQGLVEQVTSLAQSCGAWVVAVDMGGGAGLGQNERFYHRKRPVGKPTDDHFRVCFAHFLQRLEKTRTPDWQLLEGPPPPDALLAYHLLDLLRGDEAADRAREGLVDAACGEAQTIAAAEGIPPLAAIDNPAQRREFLKRCS